VDHVFQAGSQPYLLTTSSIRRDSTWSYKKTKKISFIKNLFWNKGWTRLYVMLWSLFWTFVV
jgi:hypothetical protein